jgi:hypothetical protein
MFKCKTCLKEFKLKHHLNNHLNKKIKCNKIVNQNSHPKNISIQEEFKPNEINDNDNLDLYDDNLIRVDNQFIDINKYIDNLTDEYLNDPIYDSNNTEYFINTTSIETKTETETETETSIKVEQPSFTTTNLNIDNLSSLNKSNLELVTLCENQCAHCLKILSKRSNYLRHIVMCKVKEKNEMIKILGQQNDKYNELKNILINNNQNNVTNTITTNYNTIINNTINNTIIINFKDVNFDLDNDRTLSYLRDEFEGDIKYLKAVLIEPFTDDTRPIKCIDASRDKCKIMVNGEWKLISGFDAYKESIYRIRSQYINVNNDLIKEADINDSEDPVTVEFTNNTNRITKMTDDNNIKKICKTLNYQIA